MTTASPIDVKKIKENNWRQGDIFPQEAVEKIAEKLSLPIDSKDWRIIVVSQSCDICYHKQDDELWIEVLLARLIDKQDNAAIQGRRQRCYHLEIYDKTTETKNWFDANINDRYKIDRNLCADYKPSPQWIIDPKEIRSIIQWIAYRYIRIALPDAFNNRIRHKKNDLKKLLKNNNSQYISGIYINLQPKRELSPNETYNVKIIGAIPKQYYNDQLKRKDALNHILELEKIISDCEGINVESESLSEEDISLDDIKQLERFTDYDYLSYDSD
ncbi:MAG: hypothetical protein LBP59_03630 [Planctomycetaceae bacterium]|jgi:hypothetical protein|nr:hypothetical protein [Planctomycetaceae bacterium]